jgi:hypothetical protein
MLLSLFRRSTPRTGWSSSAREAVEGVTKHEKRHEDPEEDRPACDEARPAGEPTFLRRAETRHYCMKEEFREQREH